MDRGAWRGTVHKVTKVERDLVTTHSTKFPSQGLSPVPRSESSESQPLDLQGTPIFH